MKNRSSLLGKMLLDHVNYKIDKGDKENKYDIMDELFLGLSELRQYLSIDHWDRFARDCIDHPVRSIIHQDLFTQRAFDKPRGYAGDAVLMDYIYRDESIVNEIESTSEIGKAVYEYATSTPSANAVRERKKIIANKLDELCENCDRPQVLSLACGHLREAEISNAVQGNKIHKYIAFDYDQESLKTLANKKYSKLEIQPMQGNVKDIISGKVHLGKFDFIYASGLFDYLSQGIARKLTENMFSMLRSGGKLLIGNFLPNIRDVGYMETFMNWKLVYRDPYDMDDLSINIDRETMKFKHTFIEDNKNIVFLEIGAF